MTFIESHAARAITCALLALAALAQGARAQVPADRRRLHAVAPAGDGAPRNDKNRDGLVSWREALGQAATKIKADLKMNPVFRMRAAR